MDLVTLLEEVKKVNELMLEERRNKSGFNVFEVEEIDWKEVYMCRFLRAILDPHGGHGKGNDFLVSFAKEVLNITLPPEGNYFVEKEVLIDENRRIDIVIRGEGYWIPIEAKIGAKDQPKQCYDYLQFAREKTENAILYYLTPNGRKPSKESSNGEEAFIKPISWGDKTTASKSISIRDWLKCFVEALNQDKDKVLVVCLEQYCEAIENFIYNAEVEMKLEEEMLKDVDSFRAAATIYQNYNNIKTKIMKSFFDLLEVKLAKTVEELNHEKCFLERVFSNDLSDHIDKYYKYNKSSNPSITYRFTQIGEQLSEILGQEFAFAIRIEIEDKLYIGFCFPHIVNGELKYESKPKIPSRWKDLGKKVENGLFDKGRDGWWLAWSYINCPKGKEVDFKSDDTGNESYFSLADQKNIEALVDICCEKFKEVVVDYKKNLMQW